MKRTVRFLNISEPSRADLAQRVDDLAARHLARHVQHFGPDLTRLYAVLEKNGARHLYRATLRLHLPARTLVARAEHHELAPALNEAFVELERELVRHVEQLRRDALWRRNGRRDRLRRFKQAIARPVASERALYRELVLDHLAALYRFVRRELAYLEARGELEPDEPPVDEVVDEVLVRALARWRERPARLSLREWLYGLAIRVATEEVERRRQALGGAVSLAARVPADPLGLLEREWPREHWHPEEVLRIEDLVPSAAGGPEDMAVREDVRRELARLFALLPDSWRRAVTLHRLEGLPLEQAAQLLGVDVPAVGAWLEHADAFLRAKLAEQGLAPGETGAPAEYVAYRPAPAVPELERELMALLDESEAPG